jgi:hypothetical protein
LPGYSLVEPDYGHQSEENPQNIAVGEEFAASVISPPRAGAAQGAGHESCLQHPAPGYPPAWLF